MLLSLLVKVLLLKTTPNHIKTNCITIIEHAFFIISGKNIKEIVTSQLSVSSCLVATHKPTLYVSNSGAQTWGPPNTAHMSLIIHTQFKSCRLHQVC